MMIILYQLNKFTWLLTASYIEFGRKTGFDGYLIGSFLGTEELHSYMYF